MKKSLLVGIICIMSAFLAACGQPQAHQPSPSIPLPESASPSSPLQSPEPAGPRDTYLAVLRGEMEFYNTTSKEYLDITRLREAVTSVDLPLTVKQFAVIDLDHDEIPEVILWLSIEENEYAGFEILRYQEGAVYGYTLWYREFEELKDDGSFVFSGGAFDWGMGTISFTNESYKVDPITYCEPDSQQNTIFFVEKERAAGADFNAAFEQWDAKAPAVWAAFTPEEIEKILSAQDASAADPAPLSAEEEAARGAYSDLLSGDFSLLERESLANPAQTSFYGALEYTFLDLDGDGVSELLLQRIDAPYNYNGVFHFDGGRITCWQDDAMETSCRDYPLQDGTMVRQYDVGTGPNRYSHLYTLFCYQSSGETSELTRLHVHEYTFYDGTDSYNSYGIDDEELDEESFQSQFEELVTSRLLGRSAWTPVMGNDE